MRLVTAFLLSLILSAFVIAQGRDPDIPPPAPERVMAQAVPQILRFYFKPALKPRDVLLLDASIKQEWLPKIRNIRFIVVPSEKVELYESVYEFPETRSRGRRGEIWFGKFSPGSGGEGDIWDFKQSRRGLRLWRAKYGWGSSGLDRGPDYKPPTSQ